MDTIQDSNNIQLKDRVLWFDGDTTVSLDFLVDYILDGHVIPNGVYVEEINHEITRYNKIVSKPLNVKYGLKPIDVEWRLPEEYKKSSIKKRVLKELLRELEENDIKGIEAEQRLERVENELELYKTFDKEYLLRTLIFIVDTFRKDNVVWGVGRGSSCSSYILYLIGIHDVDSFTFDLDIHEFFR